MESGTITLTREQVLFVMKMTGEVTEDDAIEAFAGAMVKESVSPTKMSSYVDMLMKRQKNPAVP